MKSGLDAMPHFLLDDLLTIFKLLQLEKHNVGAFCKI